MESKELRIGNYVNYKDCVGDLFKGEVDYIFRNIAKCGGWIVDSPIPLTEEWLVKFGFVPLGEKYCDLIWWRKGNLQLCKDEETQGFEPLLNRAIGLEGENYYLFSPDNKGSNVFVNHVHQLQNLCYALGKELTVKE